MIRAIRLDMAPEPSYFTKLGIPLYIVAGVVVLGIIAAVLIVVATRKKGKQDETDKDTADSGEKL